MAYIPARMQFIDKYISDLRAKTGYYIGYVPNSYADDPSKLNLYDLMENDVEVKRCSNLMAILVVGEGLDVVTTNPYLGEILNDLLDECLNYNVGVKSMLEKSILYGLGLQKKYYSTTVLPKYPKFEWKCIKQLKEVDRRRLRIERDAEDKTKVYWTIWSPVHDRYIILENKKLNPNALYSIQDYIWHVHEYEEQYPYFLGIGERLYSYVYCKAQIFQYWADLCETWSKPYTVIKTNMMKGALNAQAGEGFKDAESRKEDILDAFQKNFARHMIIVDKSGDEVEFHEHGAVGVNILKEFIEYIDENIKHLYFGTQLSLDSGKGGGSKFGSYALGKIHERETGYIVKYFMNSLENTLNRDYLADLIEQNWVNFRLLGISKEDLLKVRVAIRKTELKFKTLEEQTVASKPNQVEPQTEEASQNTFK